jgi:hypothetical protein
MDLNQLVTKVKSLKTVSSITGSASYSRFRLEDGNKLYFYRDNTNKLGMVKLDKLAEIHNKLAFINTLEVRPILAPERVYSPACAILIHLGYYDKKGFRK